MWQTVSDFFVFIIHQLCLYDNSSPRTDKTNNTSGSGFTNNYNSTGEHFCANRTSNDPVINLINHNHQHHLRCGDPSVPGPGPGPGPGPSAKHLLRKGSLANDDVYSYSRSIISQRIDDRSSLNLGIGPGGRRRSSSIHGAGSISGISRIGGGSNIINDRDNLDISGVANNLRDLHNAGGGSGGSGGSNASRQGSNCVQAQIERMFNDVAKEHGGPGKDSATAAAAAAAVATAPANGQTFSVRCLGSLPLKDKVTSLVGLQEPLWQLYLSGAGHGVSNKFI